MNDDHDMTRHLPNAEAMPADFEQTEALPTLVGGVSEQASAVTQALPVEPTQTLPVAETEAMPVEKVAVPQAETKSLPVDSASTEKLSAEPLAAGAVSDESAAPVDDGQTETEQVYVVQSGDTLSAIAAKYGTTYQDLAAKNGISNPNLIYPGMRLVVS